MTIKHALLRVLKPLTKEPTTVGDIQKDGDMLAMRGKGEPRFQIAILTTTVYYCSSDCRRIA